MHFHPYPAFGTFASASQVQLDMTREELLTVLRAFTKVEPVKALLFSNSVLLSEMEDILCARDMFWECSTHGINPHNVGMYEADLYSEEELLDYIASTSIYCVERDGLYINFEPVPILQYLQEPAVTGEYYDRTEGEYREITVRPEPDDIRYLRTFKYEDLTYRGTVEFRSCCCQPIRDSMTVAAFHVGLQKKLEELDRLMAEDRILYHHGYTPTELRRLFVRDVIPPYLREDDVYALTGQILDLARKGLADRRLGEERMLDPLYERWEQRTNPAKTMLRELHDGTPLEKIIRQYAAH